MPNNLILPTPTQVMPIGPMLAFSESVEHAALLDEYPDGQTARASLVTLPRRTFRLVRKLKAADMAALYSFLQAMRGRPFWFYSLKETQPPGSWDPAGLNPVGRYAVVLQGPLAQSLELGSRGTVSMELREVGY